VPNTTANDLLALGSALLEVLFEGLARPDGALLAEGVVLSRHGGGVVGVSISCDQVRRSVIIFCGPYFGRRHPQFIRTIDLKQNFQFLRTSTRVPQEWKITSRIPKLYHAARVGARGDGGLCACPLDQNRVMRTVQIGER